MSSCDAEDVSEVDTAQAARRRDSQKARCRTLKSDEKCGLTLSDLIHDADQRQEQANHDETDR